MAYDFSYKAEFKRDGLEYFVGPCAKCGARNAAEANEEAKRCSFWTDETCPCFFDNDRDPPMQLTEASIDRLLRAVPKRS